MKQILEELGFEREFYGWFLEVKENTEIKVCIDLEKIYVCNIRKNTSAEVCDFNLTKLKQLIKLCK